MRFIHLLIVLLIFLGFVRPLSANEALPSEEKAPSGELLRTIEYIMNCYANNQESSYKLLSVSKIIQLDCKIEKLGMLFDYYDTLDIPKARRLIIQAVTELLQTVNSSNKLKPYLPNCGNLTPEDVIVRIRWRSHDCGFFYPPLGNIALVSAMEGKISYDTINSYTYTINNLRTETYIEGLRLNRIPQ